MEQQYFIEQLDKAGKYIKEQIQTGKWHDTLETTYLHNPWFIPDFTSYMLQQICDNYLSKPKLEKWLSPYHLPVKKAKKVGITMAGNIPLVGFHDLLCVWISGHHALVKMSSRDNKLLPFLLEVIFRFIPEWKAQTHLVEDLFPSFDAMIATGSNNSARYFEYYFSRYPHIIRRNRNSLAILTGDENENDLKNLAHDIFCYFGMGCRSVSKIYLPDNMHIEKILEYWNEWSDLLLNHDKYKNNYIYHKSIFLVNQEEFLDNGFVLLKEDNALASPLGVIHYEFYTSLPKLLHQIQDLKEHVQIIVSRPEHVPGSVPFGKSQSPELWDYADDIDTLEFLEHIP